MRRLVIVPAKQPAAARASSDRGMRRSLRTAGGAAPMRPPRPAAEASRRPAGRRTSPGPRAGVDAGEREHRREPGLDEPEPAGRHGDLREDLRGAEGEQHQPGPSPSPTAATAASSVA